MGGPEHKQPSRCETTLGEADQPTWPTECNNSHSGRFGACGALCWIVWGVKRGCDLEARHECCVGHIPHLAATMQPENAMSGRWRDLEMLLTRQGNLVGPGFEPGPELLEFLQSEDCRVLCVGAGGLGCEILKDLALSGGRAADPNVAWPTLKCMCQADSGDLAQTSHCVCPSAKLLEGTASVCTAFVERGATWCPLQPKHANGPSPHHAAMTCHALDAQALCTLTSLTWTPSTYPTSTVSFSSGANAANLEWHGNIGRPYKTAT